MTTQSTTPKATHADIAMKSEYAVLLNTLNRMSESPIYALRRETLIQAESLIFEQERDLSCTRAALEGYLALHEDLAGAVGSKMCECQECCTARAALAAAAEKEGKP